MTSLLIQQKWRTLGNCFCQLSSAEDNDPRSKQMCSIQFFVSIIWKCIKYQEDTKRRLRMNTQTSRELRRLWDWYTIHAYIYKGPRHANECEEEDCGSHIHMLWNSIYALKPNCAETLARHTIRYCRISTDLISHCTVLYG